MSESEKSIRYMRRGVAQLAERRSPKPKAGGSRPSTPASYDQQGKRLDPVPAAQCMRDRWRWPAHGWKSEHWQRCVARGTQWPRMSRNRWRSQSTPVHPRSSSGDRQGHVADAQGGVDHHRRGPDHGDAGVAVLHAGGPGHGLAGQLDSGVRPLMPSTRAASRQDGAAAESNGIRDEEHGEAVVHRARLHQLRAQGGGRHPRAREAGRPRAPVRGDRGADRGRGGGRRGRKMQTERKFLPGLCAGQDGDDRRGVPADQEHAEGHWLPRL